MVAGKAPPIIVRVILITIKIKACIGFNLATPANPDKSSIMLFTGNVSRYAMKMPSSPDNIPMINVSALNTRLMSFFLCSWCVHI